jgi:hypothetical protein
MAVRSSSSQATPEAGGFVPASARNLDSAGSAGPAPSGPSEQDGAKHEPGTVEARTAHEFGGKPIVLLRVPCSCGWRGAWYGDPEYVARSFRRHVEGRS